MSQPLNIKHKVEKQKVHVQVHLTDNTTIGGYIFIAADERITDLLNDSREFIPLEDGTGSMTIVSKRNISKLFIPNSNQN